MNAHCSSVAEVLVTIANGGYFADWGARYDFFVGFAIDAR